MNPQPMMNLHDKSSARISRTYQKKLRESGIIHKSSGMLSDEERKAVQANKLAQLFGCSEEQRLDSFVINTLLSTNTTEGKTLKQFCSNFSVLEKNPQTLPTNVRQFCTNLREFVKETHEEELSKLVVLASNESVNLVELSVHNIIEQNIERLIIPKFRDRIIASLQLDDFPWHSHVLLLRNKPQQFFEIEEKLVSRSNWERPVAILSTLDDQSLPYQKLAVILATTHAIYSTLSEETDIFGGSHEKYLTGDELLPVFIYVVAQSEIKNPELEAEFLWKMCDERQLSGEGGYYLTVFTSSIKYIKTHWLDSLPKLEPNALLPHKKSNPVLTLRTITRNKKTPTLSSSLAPRKKETDKYLEQLLFASNNNELSDNHVDKRNKQFLKEEKDDWGIKPKERTSPIPIRQLRRSRSSTDHSLLLSSFSPLHSPSPFPKIIPSPSKFSKPINPKKQLKNLSSSKSESDMAKILNHPENHSDGQSVYYKKMDARLYAKLLYGPNPSLHHSGSHCTNNDDKLFDHQDNCSSTSNISNGDNKHNNKIGSETDSSSSEHDAYHDDMNERLLHKLLRHSGGLTPISWSPTPPRNMNAIISTDTRKTPPKVKPNKPLPELPVTWEPTTPTVKKKCSDDVNSDLNLLPLHSSSLLPSSLNSNPNSTTHQNNECTTDSFAARESAPKEKRIDMQRRNTKEESSSSSEDESYSPLCPPQTLPHTFHFSWGPPHNDDITHSETSSVSSTPETPPQYSYPFASNNFSHNNSTTNTITENSNPSEDEYAKQAKSEKEVGSGGKKRRVESRKQFQKPLPDLPLSSTLHSPLTPHLPLLNSSHTTQTLSFNPPWEPVSLNQKSSIKYSENIVKNPSDLFLSTKPSNLNVTNKKENAVQKMALSRSDGARNIGSGMSGHSLLRSFSDNNLPSTSQHKNDYVNDAMIPQILPKILFARLTIPTPTPGALKALLQKSKVS
eukprot:CAMPEP_0174265354 /NCGR_PEP_ID=MMETSP0439-20130205/26179_1 /TAXON_ID=0 /ORGANISM="Stereomyxa ramosa, Strain Chinc5" /LENGTH=957 /DNA_ID=CAMNT_0015351775 /DNA_START=289 /DNA_END=3163 /DNA_ORIENTATION=-